jgi:hypothetical protein
VDSSTLCVFTQSHQPSATFCPHTAELRRAAQVPSHRAILVAAAIKVLPHIPTSGSSCVESCCSKLLSSSQAHDIPTVQGDSQTTIGATGVPGLDLYAMGSYRRGSPDHGDIDFVLVPPPGT